MDPNPDIKKTFEIADDSLQGVLGYHFFVTAMQNGANPEKISGYLPDGVIPHTYSWDRHYQKQHLIGTLSPIFELYQSRISLIAMVNVFEVAIKNFIRGLDQNEHPQALKRDNYKERIKWARSQCNFGDSAAIPRLPKTFGKIDNARRLRNLIVHNHGLFTEFYEKDAIKHTDFKIQLHPDYAGFKKNQQILTSAKLTTNDIVDFSRSHIEVLHILHNSIQKDYFGFTDQYSYAVEQKPIEWDKVLWGR